MALSPEVKRKLLWYMEQEGGVTTWDAYMRTRWMHPGVTTTSVSRFLSKNATPRRSYKSGGKMYWVRDAKGPFSGRLPDEGTAASHALDGFLAVEARADALLEEREEQRRRQQGV